MVFEFFSVLLCWVKSFLGAEISSQNSVSKQKQMSLCLITNARKMRSFFFVWCLDDIWLSFSFVFVGWKASWSKNILTYPRKWPHNFVSCVCNVWCCSFTMVFMKCVVWLAEVVRRRSEQHSTDQLLCCVTGSFSFISSHPHLTLLSSQRLDTPQSSYCSKHKESLFHPQQLSLFCGGRRMLNRRILWNPRNGFRCLGVKDKP